MTRGPSVRSRTRVLIGSWQCGLFIPLSFLPSSTPSSSTLKFRLFVLVSSTSSQTALCKARTQSVCRPYALCSFLAALSRSFLAAVAPPPFAPQHYALVIPRPPPSGLKPLPGILTAIQPPTRDPTAHTPDPRCFLGSPRFREINHIN